MRDITTIVPWLHNNMSITTLIILPIIRELLDSLCRDGMDLCRDYNHNLKASKLTINSDAGPRYIVSVRSPWAK